MSIKGLIIQQKDPHLPGSDVNNEKNKILTRNLSMQYISQLHGLVFSSHSVRSNE